jgi:hypothetical protein
LKNEKQYISGNGVKRVSDCFTSWPPTWLRQPAAIPSAEQAETPPLPATRPPVALPPTTSSPAAMPTSKPSAFSGLCRNHKTRWLSIHGVEVCGECHPPAIGALLRWLEPKGN